MVPNRYALTLFLSALLVLAAGTPGLTAEPPETVAIDHLSLSYAGVIFDHGLHDGYAACVECHHHLTGSPPSNPACVVCHRQGTTITAIACRDCHPIQRGVEKPENGGQAAKRYHIDIPGLNGAYHLRCVTCHLAITVGPTDCQGCHTIRKERRVP